MYGEHARRGNEGHKKDYQGNKIKGTPEQRAPWSRGLMLFSQKANVMRVNPLDLIDILRDYMIVVYGIYYNNGYPDIPTWLQEETREKYLSSQ